MRRITLRSGGGTLASTPTDAGRDNAAASDGQTLAAFGAACVDDSTAAAAFHANQKSVGAGTANF